MRININKLWTKPLSNRRGLLSGICHFRMNTFRCQKKSRICLNTSEYVWKNERIETYLKFLCCEWYSSKRLVSDCLNKSDLFKNNHVSRVRDIVTRRKLLSYWACLCYHWGWKLWPSNVVIHSCRLKGLMLDRARRWHRLRGLMWASGVAENRLTRLQWPWHPYLLLF